MVQAGYPVEKFYSASAAAADDYKHSETWRLRKLKKEYFKRTLTRQMSDLQVKSRKTLFRRKMSESPKCDMNKMKKMAISTLFENLLLKMLGYI